MNVIEKPLEKIKPYRGNPRKISQEAIDKVAASIKEFGFKVPIVLDGDGVIITGHTRYLASKKLGMKTVPCILADDLTPEQVKAFRLADNRVAEFSEWDHNLLDAELGELFHLNLDMEAFGFDMTGLSPDEFGTTFSLPSGPKTLSQITFTFSPEQKAVVDESLDMVGEQSEALMFGNHSKAGNKLYEVCRQWAEQKRLS